jgi:O-antigen/teichoic acid export membrane protein
MLNIGIIIQVCNIVQLLNYRFTYFILEREYGVGILGVFATATALAESVWLISKSISIIQYAEIASSKDKFTARRSTIRFSKLSLVTSMVVYFPLLFIPDYIYAFIFGNEFQYIGTQVLIFAPGILAFSFSTILAHYFAGFGRNSVNLLIASIGLIMTIVLSLILIPHFGINGAAISVSISYLATAILYLVIFKQDVDLKFKELIPLSSEFQLLTQEIRKILKS